MSDDNRRDTYRHPFPPYNAPPVAIQFPGTSHGPESRSGEMLDLSLGGMGVRVREEEDACVAGSRCLVCFSLPGANVDRTKLLFECLVVHARKEPLGVSYGLCFLPLDSPVEEEKRARLLWNFLLEEQRRALARAKELAELNRSIEEVARQRPTEK